MIVHSGGNNQTESEEKKVKNINNLAEVYMVQCKICGIDLRRIFHPKFPDGATCGF